MERIHPLQRAQVPLGQPAFSCALKQLVVVRRLVDHRHQLGMDQVQLVRSCRVIAELRHRRPRQMVLPALSRDRQLRRETVYRCGFPLDLKAASGQLARPIRAWLETVRQTEDYR